MKIITFLLLGICMGCSGVQTAGNTESLFPVFGFTPGISTEKELAELGEKDEEYDLYVIRGKNFWMDENGVFESIDFMADEQLPLKWANMGFDWYLSFNEWVDLLKKSGFTLTYPKVPGIKKYKGKDSLSAHLRGIHTSGVPTQVDLIFDYSDKSSLDAGGTLLSIYASTPKQE